MILYVYMYAHTTFCISTFDGHFSLANQLQIQKLPCINWLNNSISGDLIWQMKQNIATNCKLLNVPHNTGMKIIVQMNCLIPCI